MAYINGTVSVIPGIYFAGIGEGWEVFFNGKLILSELHLSETVRIRERRKWNDVSFPVDGSFVVPGTDILAIRIVGDPTYRGTGLYYTSAPIYIDNYRNIETRRFDYLYIFLCGFFVFTGIYYLPVYEVIYFHLWNRQKKPRGSVPIGNILIGMTICYLCGAFDVLYNTFFKDNVLKLRVPPCTPWLILIH